VVSVRVLALVLVSASAGALDWDLKLESASGLPTG
jgi:hypothetical protein